MHRFIALILCVRFGAQAASDSNTCRRGHGDENLVQGYDFLKEGTRFYLKLTSLLLEETYTLPEGISFRCISATTSDKDSTTHTLLETVDYKNGTNGEWEQFSQWFKFSLDSGKYNRMTIVDKNGAPSGAYTFVFAVRECAVMKVDGFAKGTFDDDATSAIDVEAPAERAEQTENAQKPHCMIWAQHEAHDALQICCENYFNEHCHSKNPNYEYSPERCIMPTDRREL